MTSAAAVRADVVQRIARIRRDWRKHSATNSSNLRQRCAEAWAPPPAPRIALVSTPRTAIALAILNAAAMHDGPPASWDEHVPGVPGDVVRDVARELERAGLLVTGELAGGRR